MKRSRVAPVIAVLILAGARLYDEADATARLSLVKHYTPADRLSGRYQYVPFEVLPGARQLDISYEYDKANGDNTVDLGLFEPGSLDLGTRAFRGYSGGARTSVTITEDTASPGYRPGRLTPGRWHLLLGLYRVRDAGVDVTITIDTKATPSASARPPSDELRRDRPALPAPSASARPTPDELRRDRPAEPGWFMGALHTHTVHSDGTLNPAALMQQFDAAGFDFVVITDHNNTTHRSEMEPYSKEHPRPLWIAGEEVTTPNGHASVWGLDDNEWIDFRVKLGDTAVSELVQTATRFGALFSINHPASTCLGCGWEHDIPAGVAGIEISNGRHGEVNGALARWDALLKTGRRITGVGSSDWHAAPNPIDVANVRVYAASLSEAALLAGLKAGHVIIMNGASWKTPEVAVHAGGQAGTIGGSITIASRQPVQVVISAPDLPGGRVATVVNGSKAADTALDVQGFVQFDQPVSTGYMRFELRDANGALVALTNPVYLER
jgi:hypothetical protein